MTAEGFMRWMICRKQKAGINRYSLFALCFFLVCCTSIYIIGQTSKQTTNSTSKQSMICIVYFPANLFARHIHHSHPPSQCVSFAIPCFSPGVMGAAFRSNDPPPPDASGSAAYFFSISIVTPLLSAD